MDDRSSPRRRLPGTSGHVSAPTALVAGGAGFLGSHLCRALLDRGRRVLCVDNLQTGRRENLADLEGRRDFQFIEHDIEAPLALSADEIYNLACPASPPAYQRDPIKTITTCVTGSRNLLDLARITGAPILFTSTSEVYGDPLVALQSEDYRGNVNCYGPRACYDEGKRLAETLHYEYAHRHGVRVRIARLFNTYGPAMDPEDGRVVSTFAVQALLGRPLTVFGDGSQTRSLCYVSDTVRGLERLMERGDRVSGPINIGNPEELSVREIAERIREAAGSASPLSFGPLPEDDPMQRRPDIARARRELDWSPWVGLRAGLARTLVHFRMVLGVRNAHVAAE